jgi:hypothetical protein
MNIPKTSQEKLAYASLTDEQKRYYQHGLINSGGDTLILGNEVITNFISEKFKKEAFEEYCGKMDSINKEIKGLELES